jgi:hypothetical protein
VPCCGLRNTCNVGRNTFCNVKLIKNIWKNNEDLLIHWLEKINIDLEYKVDIAIGLKCSRFINNLSLEECEKRFHENIYMRTY